MPQTRGQEVKQGCPAGHLPPRYHVGWPREKELNKEPDGLGTFPTLPAANCVALGKSLDVSGLLIPHV